MKVTFEIEVFADCHLPFRYLCVKNPVQDLDSFIFPFQMSLSHEIRELQNNLKIIGAVIQL